MRKIAESLRSMILVSPPPAESWVTMTTLPLLAHIHLQEKEGHSDLPNI